MQCFEDNVRFNFHPNLSVPSVNANLFFWNIKVTFTLRHNKIIYCCFYDSICYGSEYLRPVHDGIYFRCLFFKTGNKSEKMTAHYNVKTLCILLLCSMFFHLLDTASKILNKSKHKQIVRAAICHYAEMWGFISHLLLP